MLEGNINLLQNLYEFLLFSHEHIMNGCTENNIQKDIYKLQK
jgi:hypothetical protein